MKPTKHILIAFLVLCANTTWSQILETKHKIAFSVGYTAMIGMDDELFFPKKPSLTGRTINANYSTKIYPWMKAGFNASHTEYSIFSATSSFSEVDATEEMILSFGPHATFHTPMKNSGWQNWIELGVMVCPEYYNYQGNRSVEINNEIHPQTGSAFNANIIEMDSPTNGVGICLGPEVTLRFSQRLSFKANINFTWRNIYTDYTNENTWGQSYLGGIAYSFGRNKQIFL